MKDYDKKVKSIELQLEFLKQLKDIKTSQAKEKVRNLIISIDVDLRWLDK